MFLASMMHLTGIAALVGSVAFMLVVFGQNPINDVLIARVAKPECRSRVYGVRYIVTFSISASAVSVIAWIHAGWGSLLCLRYSLSGRRPFSRRC